MKACRHCPELHTRPEHTATLHTCTIPEHADLGRHMHFVDGWFLLFAADPTLKENR